MNIQDIFYHGIREQIRRVLITMGPERVDDGLTAFDTGHSSWASCFFARAYPEHDLTRHAESKLMAILRLGTTIPIRMVYCTFDGACVGMTKDDMRRFVEDIRDDMRPDEINKLLRSINFATVEESEDAQASCVPGVPSER